MYPYLSIHGLRLLHRIPTANIDRAGHRTARRPELKRGLNSGKACSLDQLDILFSAVDGIVSPRVVVCSRKIRVVGALGL